MNHLITWFRIFIAATWTLGGSTFAAAVAQSQPKAYIIELQGEINPSTARLVTRGLENAAQRKATVVVIHLNTYGGMVVSADTIRIRLLNSPIPVIAFVDKNAGSAGALISIACNKIYMSPGSSMGAVTVVNGQNGQAMPDKYQSYMRGVMRATALARGRNPQIAEKMVDQNLDLPGVSPTGQVITFTPEEALKYGFSDGTARTIEEVLTLYGVKGAPTETHTEDWVERFIQFLLLPVVSSILILLIFGGLFLELKAPGLSLPGAVGVVAALLYFAPHYLHGLAEVWEIGLFVIGIGLLALEVFLIPGFGVFGVLGLACTLAGLTFGVLYNDGTDFSSFNWTEIVNRMAISLLALGAALVGAFWLGRSLLKGDRAYPFVDHNTISKRAVVDGLEQYFGLTAQTATDLKPIGFVEINGERLEAQTRGELVRKGQTVRILGQDTGTLVVQPVVSEA